MKKVYLNNYYNRAIIIDEEARTYTLTSATTASSIQSADWRVWWAKVERIGEVLKQLKERGFKGYKRA